MTNEEALAHFKNHEYMTDFSWQDEMSEVALKAIEKQIPKKPIIDIGYDMEGNAWNNWRCPCCRENYLLDEEEHDYCPHCGQRIDWEEGEKE